MGPAGGVDKLATEGGDTVSELPGNNLSVCIMSFPS